MTRARYERSVVWLRRDLRLADNAALAAAAENSGRVLLAFVLSPALLRSPRMGAPLVQSFFSALDALRNDLRERGSDLALLEGDFAAELIALCKRSGATAVFYNEDYEPQALERDAQVERALRAAGIAVHASLDHVYFGAREVRQHDGSPYKVFTPYKRRWLEQARVAPRKPFAAFESNDRLASREEIGATRTVPELGEFGFESSAAHAPVSERAADSALKRFLAGPVHSYARDRDFPALAGTSHLSTHLRAGTIGIRTCVDAAFDAGADAWLSELIWRDFYQMILWHFPHVAAGPFLEAAGAIEWRAAPGEFERWRTAQTGYPIVDAAMTQLNTTGWMHNRLRMIVASFLTKHLLIDWRRGELYFEQHLSDADLAANNGGWQWSASTGNDPVPYFRIFNPILQSRKFDPDGVFIRTMLPQFAGVALPFVHEPWRSPEPVPGYPAPIVEHKFARERALAVYGKAMKRRIIVPRA